jgi:hypothetical protein
LTEPENIQRITICRKCFGNKNHNPPDKQLLFCRIRFWCRIPFGMIIAMTTLMKSQTSWPTSSWFTYINGRLPHKFPSSRSDFEWPRWHHELESPNRNFIGQIFNEVFQFIQPL